MKKINVLFDTNVLIKASLQEKDRIELTKLIGLTKRKIIKFIMFEIVLDEFQKYSDKLEDSLTQEIGKVSKGIRNSLAKCQLWNELNDLGDYLSNSLYKYQGEKYHQATSFIEEINNLVKMEK